MTEQAPGRRTSPFIVWPVCVFLLVAMYLASLGPFFWLDGHDVFSERTSDAIYNWVYFPIDWTDANTDLFNNNPIGEAYVEYVNWWLE